MDNIMNIISNRYKHIIMYIDRREGRIITMIILNMRWTVIIRRKFQLTDSCNANN